MHLGKSESLIYVCERYFYVNRTDTLSVILNRHKNVFDKGLGTIEGFVADVQLQDYAKPVFC